ncbi:hypothetical protein ACW9FF_04845 [Ralstonia mannitolilytica]
MAVPDPDEQTTFTVAPDKAAPVAATPVMVCDCGAGFCAGAEVPPAATG